MTKEEARERMLVALAAAGVNGIDTQAIDGDDFQENIEALRALRMEGVAVIRRGGWRLSDWEFARRILAAVGLDDGEERERLLLDRVAAILRGAP